MDYLKYDRCSPEGALPDQIQASTLMRDALRDTGRTIVYSINANSYHDEKNGARYNWSEIADMSHTNRGHQVRLADRQPQHLPDGRRGRPST